MGKNRGGKTVSLTEKREEVRENLGEILERGRLLDRVAPDFKVVVSDLRDFLEAMKQKLDAEESKIQSEAPEEQDLVEREVLNIAEEIATDYVNNAISRMNEIVSTLTQVEHNIHRNYFQHHLHPFLLLSPFVRRAYLKPLGCPGDYEVMNMLYGDHDQGESLFARLINRYSCQVTAARSVRERVPYMLGKINQTIERVSRRREVVSIASMGCGPAREIQELIETTPHSDWCHVSLTDMAKEALWHCYTKILELTLVTRSRIRVNYLNQSIHQLIRTPHALDPLMGQDLIYALGLFDYLPFHVARHAVRRLYRLLSEGGELIIGNFDCSNDSRYYMEYGAEWYLFYRAREEMVRLTEGLPSPARVSVETDERGVQLFLIIEKAAGEEDPLCTTPEVPTVFCERP